MQVTICLRTIKKEAIISHAIWKRFRESFIRTQASDPIILLLTLGLSAFGLVMVYSSSYIFAQERYGNGLHYFHKHIIFLGLGILLMLLFRFVHCRVWKELAPHFFFLSLCSLLLIYIPGLKHTAGGATRWLMLGPYTVQPIEFVKVFFILYMAYRLSQPKYRGKLNQGKDLLTHLWPCFIIIALTIFQPDFGAVVLIATTSIVLLYIAGAKLRYLALFILSSLPALMSFILIEPYRKARFLSFLNPWADPQDSGFQIIQSFLAFYRGGLFGVGLGNSKEKIFYLPEAHNDFILSVIAEEIGFIGFFLICIAFLALFFRSIQIAHRAKNSFEKLLAAGLATLIALEAFWNASVVLGLLPTKGINLPFISTGGSSIISSFIAIGLLLGISAKSPIRKTYY